MDGVNILADTGPSGQYLDDQLVPGLRDWMLDLEELEVPREVTTAGEQVLLLILVIL